MASTKPKREAKAAVGWEALPSGTSELASLGCMEPYASPVIIS